MTIEKQPFEDVSPIKQWWCSIVMLVFRCVSPQLICFVFFFPNFCWELNAGGEEDGVNNEDANPEDLYSKPEEGAWWCNMDEGFHSNQTEEMVV